MPDYYLSEAERTYVDQCRFLQVVSRVCPEFWDVLRATVLPNFPEGISARSIRRGYMDPALIPIQPSFRAWLQRFSIESATWLQQIALRTLRGWQEHPGVQGFEPGVARTKTENTTVQFTFDILTESKTAVIKRFNAVVADSYKQARPFNEAHAEYLALFQFAGWSPHRIAAWSRQHRRHCSVETVQKGYQAAAERLSITLRRPRRGRAAGRAGQK
jgi:hypothetical protein